MRRQRLPSSGCETEDESFNPTTMSWISKDSHLDVSVGGGKNYTSKSFNVTTEELRQIVSVYSHLSQGEDGEFVNAGVVVDLGPVAGSTTGEHNYANLKFDKDMNWLPKPGTKLDAYDVLPYVEEGSARRLEWSKTSNCPVGYREKEDTIFWRWNREKIAAEGETCPIVLYNAGDKRDELLDRGGRQNVTSFKVITVTEALANLL